MFSAPTTCFRGHCPAAEAPTPPPPKPEEAAVTLTARRGCCGRLMLLLAAEAAALVAGPLTQPPFAARAALTAWDEEYVVVDLQGEKRGEKKASLPRNSKKFCCDIFPSSRTGRGRGRAEGPPLHHGPACLTSAVTKYWGDYPLIKKHSSSPRVQRREPVRQAVHFLVRRRRRGQRGAGLLLPAPLAARGGRRGAIAILLWFVVTASAVVVVFVKVSRRQMGAESGARKKSM